MRLVDATAGATHSLRSSDNSADGRSCLRSRLRQLTHLSGFGRIHRSIHARLNRTEVMGGWTLRTWMTPWTTPLHCSGVMIVPRVIGEKSLSSRGTRYLSRSINCEAGFKAWLNHWELHAILPSCSKNRDSSETCPIKPLQSKTADWHQRSPGPALISWIAICTHA